MQLPDDPDSASVQALAPSTAIAKLIEKNWGSQEFRAWWSSPNWEKEESQRLLHLAMGRLSEILVEEEDPSLVLSAAKEAREVYTRLNGQEKQRFADEDINSMDQKQLEEFLRRNSSLINSISNKSK
jgi:ABC-type antimicrobial peptide transport system ATPase subunit